jgi:hypothetical protein
MQKLYDVTQNVRKALEIAFEGFLAFENVIYIATAFFFFLKQQNFQLLLLILP